LKWGAKIPLILAASQPPTPENLQIAREALSKAKQESISIPKSIIEQAGRNFVEAAQTDPMAWDVALDFVNYNSSKNRSSPAVDVNAIKAGRLTTNYGSYIIRFPGRPDPQMRTIGREWVPEADAARFDLIGVQRNPSGTPGPKGLYISGGALIIDNMDIKNCVFDGVEIHYSGNPLILENVIFLNCTFVFENNDPGRTLGNQLLVAGASAVNFRNPA
jgi:hypothetical protein